MKKYLVTFGKYREIIEANNYFNARVKFFQKHGVSDSMPVPFNLVKVREVKSYDKEDNL